MKIIRYQLKFLNGLMFIKISSHEDIGIYHYPEIVVRLQKRQKIHTHLVQQVLQKNGVEAIKRIFYSFN